MSRGLEHLPAEVIVQICGYVPQYIARLRLASRMLSTSTTAAYVDEFIEVVRIVPEVDHLCVDYLDALAIGNNTFFLDNVEELVFHTTIVSWRGDADDLRDDDKLKASVDRIHHVLRRVLPKLPNLKKVTITARPPARSDREEPTHSFIGMDAMLQYHRDVMHQNDALDIRGRPLPHKHVVAMVWKILYVIAKSSNALAPGVEFDIDMTNEPLALRDLVRGLSGKPCAIATCGMVKSLGVQLHDILNTTYATVFEGNIPFGFASNHMVRPDRPTGEGVHSCQSIGQAQRNDFENDYVTVHRSILLSFFRHFPNLRKLDLMFTFDRLPISTPYDAIPSWLPGSLQ